jgi:RsiW-degrading membrane proteinase PrsW (M82 family)
MMSAVLHIVNILVALVMLAFFHSRLRHISDKRQEHVVWAFVVAGLFSSFLVLILYGLYPARLGAVLSRSELLFHIFVVGIVEETGKFLAFLFVAHAVGRIREPQDGAVFGAIVGLTFGVVENMSYFHLVSELGADSATIPERSWSRGVWCDLGRNVFSGDLREQGRA